VTGPAESSDQGTFLLSTDASGNISWSYKFGAPGSTSEGYGITTAPDGGYLVCGFYSNNNDEILQFLKTNSNGYLPCNSTVYGLSASSLTLPMQSIAVATGTTNLSAQDLILNETSYSNLGTICLGTGIPAISESSVTLSPNPSDGRFTITAPQSSAGSKITIVNTTGLELFHSSMPAGDGSNAISKQVTINLPAGAYFVKIDDGKQLTTRKLLINR